MPYAEFSSAKRGLLCGRLQYTADQLRQLNTHQRINPDIVQHLQNLLIFQNNTQTYAKL